MRQSGPKMASAHAATMPNAAQAGTQDESAGAGRTDGIPGIATGLPAPLSDYWSDDIAADQRDADALRDAEQILLDTHDRINLDEMGPVERTEHYQRMWRIIRHLQREYGDRCRSCGCPESRSIKCDVPTDTGTEEQEFTKCARCGEDWTDG